MKTNITTIISDLGGVYLNKGLWFFWTYLENQFGIPFEISKSKFMENYNDLFSGKINEEEFWKIFLNKINLEKDWNELRKILIDQYKVDPEMVKLYDQLRKKYKLVLLSDQVKEWWPEINNKFNISDHFDQIVISALVGFNKPDPQIYKYTLEYTKSNPNECIFIDDRAENLVPAKELGITPVLFESQNKLVENLKNINILVN